MKKPAIFFILLISYNSYAQSAWVYEKKLREIDNYSWDNMSQVNKDYFWNKVNKYAKLGLMVQRNRFIEMENEKSTIPTIEEVRDVVMDSPNPIKRPTPVRKDPEKKTSVKGVITTRGGVKYKHEDIGVPKYAMKVKESYYKTSYSDWVTYNFKYHKKYYSVTLGNSKYEIVSTYETEIDY